MQYIFFVICLLLLYSRYIYIYVYTFFLYVLEVFLLILNFNTRLTDTGTADTAHYNQTNQTNQPIHSTLRSQLFETRLKFAN